MARLTVATGSGSDVPEPMDAAVRPALAAAALLVAHQVAAKATRDALFLSNFPVTALPVVSFAAAAVSMAGVLAFSRGMARFSPPVFLRRVLVLSAVLLWAQWALSLVVPALPGAPFPVALRAWRGGDRALRGTALEYLENVLPSAVWAVLWPWLGARPVSSGRTTEAIRDDLLRSTASWHAARRSTRGGPVA